MKRIPALILVLLCAIPVKAQIMSGYLNADGATNFNIGHTENLALGLNWDTEKWFLHTSIYGKHDYSPSEIIAAAFNTSETLDNLNVEELRQSVSTGEITKAYFNFGPISDRTWGAGVKLDAGVNITSDDVLKATFSYDYNGQDKQTESDILELAYDNTQEDNIRDSFGLQVDTLSSGTDKFCLDLGYSHKFDRPGRLLKTNFTSTFKRITESTSRLLLETDEEEFKNIGLYKAPDALHNLNYSISVGYDDDRFCDVENFKAGFAIKLIQGSDIDGYKRFDMSETGWLDSGYEQHFIYNSFTLEPQISLSYSIGRFDFAIVERPQWYLHKMNNSISQDGDFNRNEWANFLVTGVNYRPADRHNITLGYSMGIIRPSYDKLTHMVKLGDFEKEFCIGNSNLRPEKNLDLSLIYSYVISKVFATYFSFSYSRQDDKAERVVDNKVDGITYFTYANSGVQQSPNMKVGLKASYENFKGEIYFKSSYDFISYRNIEKESKEAFSWEIIADLSYNFRKGWAVAAKGGYASAKISAYTYDEQYVKTDLRVTKSFKNKVDLYLEGRDLADRPIRKYTWNESLDYCRVDETTAYRRALVLGVRYRF